ncbi:MAG: hypothetical protein R3A44_15040 [Caldilineaceae bacterium]
MRGLEQLSTLVRGLQMAGPELSGGSSSDFDDAISSVGHSVETIVRTLTGYLHTNVEDDGYATGREEDEAGNIWSIEVAGEPEAVVEFAAQNDNKPVEYSIDYHDSADDAPILPPQDKSFDPPPSGDDTPGKINVVVNVKLAEGMLDSHQMVDVKIVIDPPIEMGEFDNYTIRIEKPVGAAWQNFAVGYNVDNGAISVIPGGSLSLGVNSTNQAGVVKAFAQSSIYTFSVKGVHPDGATYRVSPQGRIRLSDQFGQQL